MNRCVEIGGQNHLLLEAHRAYTTPTKGLCRASSKLNIWSCFYKFTNGVVIPSICIYRHWGSIQLVRKDTWKTVQFFKTTRIESGSAIRQGLQNQKQSMPHMKCASFKAVRFIWMYQYSTFSDTDRSSSRSAKHCELFCTRGQLEVSLAN